MTKQQIEDRLFNFLNDKMENGDAPEIEKVKRFEDYLYTRDNGIIIDCVDGTEIYLTITRIAR